MYSLYIHGQTDRAQILCGTLNDPMKEDFWTISKLKKTS